MLGKAKNDPVIGEEIRERLESGDLPESTYGAEEFIDNLREEAKNRQEGEKSKPATKPKDTAPAHEEKPAQDTETKQTVPREVTPESGEKLSETKKAATEGDIAEQTKKAAVTVTGDEFGEYSDLKDLRNKAIQYYKEHLQGTSVENKTLGKIDIDENGLVEFTATGRKKVESTSAQEQKLLLVKHLPQLIRYATEIQKADAIKERHKDDIFYYMKNHAVINGKQIPIHITLIKHNTGRIQFYNHAIETENAPVNSAEPVSSNEALGFPPVGAFSTKTIPQDSDDDKANLKPHHPTREETKPESKSAEKETDEQSAIEELKAKTKAELEEILEADKYPSIQEYLDDSFKYLRGCW